MDICWDYMQPWDRIEHKLKDIEMKIEEIRQDVNSWRPQEWESYYENDPFTTSKNTKLNTNKDVNLDQ